MEEKAARAYDLAALKYWGPSTHINFPVSYVFTFSIVWTQMQILVFIIFYRHRSDSFYNYRLRIIRTSWKR
jgi:AP2-like factor, ANT lineage